MYIILEKSRRTSYRISVFEEIERKSRGGHITERVSVEGEGGDKERERGREKERKIEVLSLSLTILLILKSLECLGRTL